MGRFASLLLAAAVVVIMFMATTPFISATSCHPPPINPHKPMLDEKQMFTSGTPMEKNLVNFDWLGMIRFAGIVLIAVAVLLGMASVLCIPATMDRGAPVVGRKLLEATPRQPLIHASLRDQPGPPSPTHNVGKLQSVPPPPPMQPAPSA
ncbi:hypothetical protein C4D60_Mb04t24690 [Musa balbisiana]|uniref:Transmembrane protein n=1 Tax=Musa balbisiana TaxID=52838 RepID=A0A4S8KEH7_MUSBA|nr:hypothetical protein C4D60_Mb04t24690 [Musa balbisiana]